MSEQRELTVHQQRRQSFINQLEQQTETFAYSLPSNVPVERFKAVVLTAVNQNQDLLYADRGTLLTAATKCATDGLLPDGREAALVVYPNTKVRRRNQAGLTVETNIDAVQYMPMIAGIRKRMRNSGEVLSAYAEVVYSNDEFYREYGDEMKIVHRPPDLGKDRGEPIGAYAIIKLKNGEILRDIMDKAAIERARNVSRAKNGPMWTQFADEAWKKTVLRRCSKAAPTSSELLIRGSEDEEDIFSERRQLAAPVLENGGDDVPTTPPPRPPQIDRLVEVVGLDEDSDPVASDPEPEHSEPPAETYEVIDGDGTVREFVNVVHAVEALELMMMTEATTLAALTGLWESNADLCTYLYSGEYRDLADRVAETYKDRRVALTPPPRQRRKAAEPPVQKAGPPEAQAPTPEELAEAEAARRADAGTPMPVPPEPEAQAPPVASPVAMPPPPIIGEGGVTAGEWYRRDDLSIPPPHRNGKPNWTTWMTAMFSPRLKGALTNAALARFLGDNEAVINSYKAAMGPGMAQAVENLIAQQWQRVPPNS